MYRKHVKTSLTVSKSHCLYKYIVDYISGMKLTILIFINTIYNIQFEV